MLIYSKDRLVPTDVNMMVIRAKDNVGYFYIHRALYDQAVVIHDIYGEDPSNLIKSLTGKEESREDVDYFLENVPTPINIFGPYLLLIKETLSDFEDMVGAIHVMSGPLHLRNMLKIPFEMRNTMPSFSLSIQEEYQLAWDRFFQNTMPYSTDMFHKQEIQPMNGVQTVTVESESTSEPTGYEEYGIDADALAFLMDEDPFAELDEENEEEDTTQQSVTTTTESESESESVPVPVPETEPEPEPKPEPEKPQKLYGVDALMSLV